MALALGIEFALQMRVELARRLLVLIRLLLALARARLRLTRIGMERIGLARIWMERLRMNGGVGGNGRRRLSGRRRLRLGAFLVGFGRAGLRQRLTFEGELAPIGNGEFRLFLFWHIELWAYLA